MNKQSNPQSNGSKPKILVARAIFPEALAKLEESFEVFSNQPDRIFSPEELQKELANVVGALVAGSERIDATALAHAKNLKVVANISVGYNNFDVPAITAAGVMASLGHETFAAAASTAVSAVDALETVGISGANGAA